MVWGGRRGGIGKLGRGGKGQAEGAGEMCASLKLGGRGIKARRAVAERQGAWVKAQVLLDAAQGVLLERYK